MCIRDRSLKDLKDLSFQDQLNNFQIILSEIISRNEELLISEHLDEMDRDLLKRYKAGTVNKAQLQNGLRFLSNCLEKHWKKRLLDVYKRQEHGGILLLDLHNKGMCDFYIVL